MTDKVECYDWLNIPEASADLYLELCHTLEKKDQKTKGDYLNLAKFMNKALTDFMALND